MNPVERSVVLRKDPGGLEPKKLEDLRGHPGSPRPGQMPWCLLQEHWGDTEGYRGGQGRRLDSLERISPAAVQ